MATTKAYLLVVPTYTRSGTYHSGPFKGERTLDRVTIKAVYVKKPPPSTIGNGIVVEVEMDIDDAAFYPIKPVVKVNVPVDATTEEVEVFAPPVVKGRVKSAAAKAVLG